MTMINYIIKGLLGILSLIVTSIEYILLFVIFLIMILIGIPFLLLTSPIWIILSIIDIDRKEK